MEQLEFGSDYSQHLHKVKFPKSFKNIIFRCYNNNQLSECINEIRIKYLTEPIKNLPMGITKIKIITNAEVDEEEDIKYIKKLVKKSKNPFGCEVIYVNQDDDDDCDDGYNFNSDMLDSDEEVDIL